MTAAAARSCAGMHGFGANDMLNQTNVAATTRAEDGLWEVARNPLATTGVIVSTDCENHALVHYRYQADGTTYSGKASRTINCKKLEVNNQIQIFYAGDDPATNELYDTQKNSHFGRYLYRDRSVLLIKYHSPYNFFAMEEFQELSTLKRRVVLFVSTELITNYGDGPRTVSGVQIISLTGSF